VDEWNLGIPASGQDLSVAYAPGRTTNVSDIRIVSIGSETIKADPTKDDESETVNRAGKTVANAVVTDNRTTRNFSMESFRPVVTSIAPETELKFQKAERYKFWSLSALGAATASIAATSFIPPALAFGVWSALFETGVFLSNKSAEEYTEIENLYNQSAAGVRVDKAQSAAQLPLSKPQSLN
jgi:hypothetical protein